MVTNSSKVVLEYVKRVLFGMLSINYTIVDRFPHIKHYHLPRKYIHITTVYFLGVPVFESECTSFTIGTFKENFCLEGNSDNKILELLAEEYKPIYKNEYLPKG